MTYFVSATIKKTSKGKTYKLIVSCSSLAEAHIVARNARRRGMRTVWIHPEHAPRFSSFRYYVQSHGREKSDYEEWFVDHPEWSKDNGNDK